MANLLSRVEALGMAADVLAAMDAGKSLREIHRSLSEKHPSRQIPSIKAIGNFIKARRAETAPIAAKIFQEHVAKELPKDLAVIEEMQASVLDLMRDPGEPLADRMGEELETIAGIIDGEGDTEAKAKACSRHFLAAVARVDKHLERKLKAARALVNVMDLKLKHGGLLEGEGDSGIVIVDRSGEYRQEDRDGDGYAKTSFDFGDGVGNA